MKLRHLLFLAPCLAASLPAGAQLAMTPTVVVTAGQPKAIGRAACLAGAGTAVTYDFPMGLGGTTPELTVFLSESSTCPNAAGDAKNILQRATTITESNRGGTVSVPASRLGGDDCPVGLEKAFLVCAVAKSLTTDYYGATKEEFRSANVAISYDSQWPAAPKLTEVTGGERSLYLAWQSEEVARIVAWYRPLGPAPEGPGGECGSIGSSQARLDGQDGGLDDGGDAGEEPPGDAAVPDATAVGPDAGTAAADGGVTGLDAGRDTSEFQSASFDGTRREGVIAGLVNDQEYEVFLVSFDSAENGSPDGNPLTGTPRLVHDFYKRYRCRGGQEQGGFGCSSAGMALWPLAGLAAAILARQLRRKP